MAPTLSLVDATFRVLKAELRAKRIARLISEAVWKPINACLELKVNAVGRLASDRRLASDIRG